MSNTKCSELFYRLYKKHGPAIDLKFPFRRLTASVIKAPNAFLPLQEFTNLDDDKMFEFLKYFTSEVGLSKLSSLEMVKEYFHLKDVRSKVVFSLTFIQLYRGLKN